MAFEGDHTSQLSVTETSEATSTGVDIILQTPRRLNQSSMTQRGPVSEYGAYPQSRASNGDGAVGTDKRKVQDQPSFFDERNKPRFRPLATSGGVRSGKNSLRASLARPQQQVPMPHSAGWCIEILCTAVFDSIFVFGEDGISAVVF